MFEIAQAPTLILLVILLHIIHLCIYIYVICIHVIFHIVYAFLSLLGLIAGGALSAGSAEGHCASLGSGIAVGGVDSGVWVYSGLVFRGCDFTAWGFWGLRVLGLRECRVKDLRIGALEILASWPIALKRRE